MLKKILFFIVCVFSAKSFSLEVCSEGVRLDQIHIRTSGTSRCDYDYWYLGRKSRGLTYRHRDKKRSTVLTEIDSFSKRDPISDYHQYFTELSRVTLLNKNGDLIVDRKLKIKAFIKALGLSKDYLPSGAKIRNDIIGKQKVLEVIVAIGSDGQIIIPNIGISSDYSFDSWKRSDYFVNRGDEAQKGHSMMNDLNYHHMRMDILNGLVDSDISNDLKENYSIDVEVTDLGPSPSPILPQIRSEELALKDLEKNLQVLEQKRIANKFLLGQGVLDKERGRLKEFKELSSLVEQDRLYDEAIMKMKLQRDSLLKTIASRKKVDSLSIVGQKIELAKIDGDVTISDFMSTNHKAFKLPIYYANSQGLWVKVYQHRSIFAIKGILDASVFDKKYHEQYQELIGQ